MSLIDRLTKSYVSTGSSQLETGDAPKPDSSASSSGIARTPDSFKNTVSVKTGLFSDPKPKTLISGNNQPPFPIPKLQGPAIPNLPLIVDKPAQPGISEVGENHFGALVNPSDEDMTTSKIVDYLAEPESTEPVTSKPITTSGNNQLPVTIPKSGPTAPAWLQSIVIPPAQPGITQVGENQFGSLVNSTDAVPSESRIIDYLTESKQPEPIVDTPKQGTSGNNQLPLSIPKSGPPIPPWLQNFMDLPIQPELTQADEGLVNSVEEKETTSEKNPLIDPEKH
jgi:hypothetical protein